MAIEASPTLLETFQSLLNSLRGSQDDNYDIMDYPASSFMHQEDDEDVFDNLSSHRGQLCAELYRQLHQEEIQHPRSRFFHNSKGADDAMDGENRDPNQDYKKRIITDKENSISGTNTSIRALFPDQRVSDLLEEVMTPLLNARVENEQLLPATQDVDANEEVLEDKAALSLTTPSLQAGRLYAHLLRRPGALGSGLVDLEALTALVALIRRWNVECCGREKDALSTREPQVSDGSLTAGGSPSKSPPSKRWKGLTAEDFEENGGKDYNNESSIVVQDNVLALGSLVALEVSKIPQQQEFSSWSSESREILLDAIVCAMGTAAALIPIQNSDAARIFTAQCILEDGQKSLVQSLAGKSTIGDEGQFQTQDHESAVAILRGLLRLLQLKLVLPNGERGLQHAHDMAGQVLALLMQQMWERVHSDSSEWRLSRTPCRKSRRRSSVGSTTKTPRSVPSKGRISLVGIPIMTSPALKKKHSRSSGMGTSALDDRKPRGVSALFVGLLQKVATSKSGLEKAALRKSTVRTILFCLEWMLHADRTHYLRYMVKICHSKVSVHRLVACELLGEVLAQPWLQQHGGDLAGEDEDDYDSENDTPFDRKAAVTLPRALWDALRGRLVDRISSVRAAAAASLESALSSVQLQCSNETGLIDEDVEQLLASLTRRAVNDETATVRKTSVVALAKLLAVFKNRILEYHLMAICDLCHDASLLTRRAAAEALTMLLQVFTDSPPDDVHFTQLLEDAWSACVLPMVLDEETSVKAVNAFLQIVVEPILDDEAFSKGQNGAAWRILSNVGNICGQHGASKGVSRSLEKALSQLTRENSDLIKVELVTAVSAIAVETLGHDNFHESQVIGVWCLFDALLSVDGVKPKRKTKKYDFCIRGWEIMLRKYSDAPQTLWLKTALKLCLSALSKSASSMESTEAEGCREKLLQCVSNFSFPTDAIGCAIAAMKELSLSVDSSSLDFENASELWIQLVYDRCEEEISDFLQSLDREALQMHSMQPKLLRALFTAGEVSVVGFNPDDDDKASPFSFNAPPSKRLKALIQIMVSYSLPGNVDRKIPFNVRAHAFTVLGKFCLRDESLARKSLTLLARELHPSVSNSDPSVQSNALLVLGDLCVRYTNMSDRYLPVMASCLQNGTENTDSLSYMDRSAVVRKHAVLLLSGLLLQDYIKWRGLLFHRFLVACSDDDEDVATLAETVLSGPLWARNTKLFFNHFVESVFVLNGCTAHPIYVAAANQGDGGSGIAVGFDGINISGPEGESRRRRMYIFLLSKLSDEEKIGVTARLAKEVLGGAIESSGDLSKACQGPPPNDGVGHPRWQSAWAVLTDTFYVLTSKAIKVRRVQEDADTVALEDPNLPNATRQVIAAKNRLLSKISLKHVMEIVLPILCSMKVKLQADNSPLLKELMMYLLEIFRSHKAEVKEFLANDPQLLQEIEFDARQQQQQTEKQ